jgi:hypothetical protein
MRLGRGFEEIIETACFFCTFAVGLRYLHGADPIPGFYSLLAAIGSTAIVRWIFKVLIRKNYI